MSTMNETQLGEFVREQTLAAIKSVVPGEVTDIVAEAMAKALAPVNEQMTSWEARLAETNKPEPTKRDPGVAFGLYVRALAAGRNDQSRACDIMEKWGHQDIADIVSAHGTKALAAGDATAGGYLVPPEISSDVIELLRAATIMRSHGTPSIQMNTGTFQVPKITAGVTGTYIGENTNITKAEPTFGQIQLTFKKLAVLVPMSNDLMRYSSPTADAIVRNDIVRGMATREDQAFLRDNGASGTPKGLRYWAPAANIIAANSSVSLANVTTDLGKLVLQHKANNVPLSRPLWIMSPRSEHYLSTVLNTNGQFVYRDEIIAGRLWGWPVGVSTSIPNTLTESGGSTDSEVYLVDLDDCVIGESANLAVDASDTAAYHDGSAVVAAFSQDQTVVRAIAEHDFAVRRAEAVALLNQVTWGA